MNSNSRYRNAEKLPQSFEDTPEMRWISDLESDDLSKLINAHGELYDFALEVGSSVAFDSSMKYEEPSLAPLKKRLGDPLGLAFATVCRRAALRISHETDKEVENAYAMIANSIARYVHSPALHMFVSPNTLLVKIYPFRDEP